MSTLTTPHKIQLFLDSLTYSADPFYRCPLRVMKERIAHCFDGALFAANALRRIGFPPLIVDMIPNHRDDDHLLAIFKQGGYWGAVAKSNFAGLRFRDCIYRNLRELVISYFDSYFNIEREKTLRGYTAPLNLSRFPAPWEIDDEPLEDIAQKLDEIRKFRLLTNEQEAALPLVDDRTYHAGLYGADSAGLFHPPTMK
ncbi:MAG: hypothetical protein EHM72_12455 [Calditrichaeota bacterium]|nr:MAG: hypothetical protein EHM72_12455 [Calditrichota bacterium]